jgi:hypothetical protein
MTYLHPLDIFLYGGRCETSDDIHEATIITQQNQVPILLRYIQSRQWIINAAYNQRSLQSMPLSTA